MMVQYVILFRNPSNGRVGYIGEEGDPEEIATFNSLPEAEEFAKGHTLLEAWPYQIVELDI